MEELLNSSVASQKLCEMFPEKTSEQWKLWLQNNRNLSRKSSYTIPFTRISGGTFYLLEEIERFIEWEKGRKLGSISITGRAAETMRAYGIGEAGGGSTGRKFDCTLISAQIDSVTNKPFVQLILNNPLMVFRIEPEQAATIAHEMLEAVNVGLKVCNES